MNNCTACIMLKTPELLMEIFQCATNQTTFHALSHNALGCSNGSWLQQSHSQHLSLKCQSDGKRVEKERSSSWSIVLDHVWNMVEAVLWYGHAWLPMEWAHWCFFDDLTADRCRMMSSEVYKVILSAHFQPNATKLREWCFRVQMDDNTWHTE